MSPSEETRHLIRLQDLSREQLDDVLGLSCELRETADAQVDLVGRAIGMLFFKGSLRTRASFEVSVSQLGGTAVNLTAASDFWQLEEREGVIMDGPAPEHVRDAAAVLSSYLDALAIRPSVGGLNWEEDRRDASIRTWAGNATVPVINMESALWHPLQALADLMTLRETIGSTAGAPLAIVWVHSPAPTSPAVAHSLLHAAAREGMDVRVAYPTGFDLDQGVVDEAHSLAAAAGGKIATGLSLEDAVRGARVVYARSWQSLESYGNPTLSASRLGRFTQWMVDENLMALGEEAQFMHAMPVRRNVEVSDAVLDGNRSLVNLQAANRLHTQKALLLRLFNN